MAKAVATMVIVLTETIEIPDDWTEEQAANHLESKLTHDCYVNVDVLQLGISDPRIYDAKVNVTEIGWRQRDYE